MAKLNGTTLLVYCDGTLVASQKNVTINWEQDLPDATDKDSAGWESHINGVRRATVDFDGLYNNTGLNAEEFVTYITGRANCVLVIDGTGVPIVGEARIRNISVNAEKETVATFSGAFTSDGPLWMLTGAYVNLMTDPDGNGQSYDTFTISGISVTSAINASGGAAALSNNISIADTNIYKVITFLTLNSGEAPSVILTELPSTNISNSETLTAGVNVITLTASKTATGVLQIYNSNASDYKLSNIYVFKV